MSRKRRLLAGFIIAASLLLGFLTFAVAGARSRLFVVNTLSENISIIDMAADRSLGAIPLGRHGYRIAFAPDGKTAYVTASAPTQPNQTAGVSQNAQTADSRLLVVDLEHQRVSDAIPMLISPLADVLVDPGGRKAYVVSAGSQGARNSQRGRVLFVDLPHRIVSRTLNIGLNPLDSVITPDGKLLVTAEWGSRSISIVDLHAERLLDSIPLGAAACRTLAISPDGRAIYAALETLPAAFYNAAQSNMNSNTNSNMQANQSSVFNNTGTALAQIDPGAGSLTPLPIDGLRDVTALAVSPDGKKLYAYATLLKLQTDSRAPTQRVGSNVQQHLDVQQMPQQVQQQSKTEEMHTLVTIDLTRQQIVNRFPMQGYIASIAVNADGSKLYLIGAPGDPLQEATVQARINSRRTMNRTMAKGGTLPGMGKASDNSPSIGQAADAAMQNDSISDLLNDLSQLPKTLIVLDAATGKLLKTLPLGSLPQGYGLVK